MSKQTVMVNLENLEKGLTDFNEETSRSAQIGNFFVNINARKLSGEQFNIPIFELFVEHGDHNIVLDLPREGWQQEVVISALPDIAQQSGKDLEKFQTLTKEAIEMVEGKEEPTEEELASFRLALGERLSKMK